MEVSPRINIDLMLLDGLNDVAVIIITPMMNDQRFDGEWVDDRAADFVSVCRLLSDEYDEEILGAKDGNR